MRFSTDEKDRGYDAWCRALSEGKTVKVYLDDVEQRDCEMADDEAGEVSRAKRNEADELYLVGEEIARETVRGVVRIEVTTPPAEA